MKNGFFDKAFAACKHKTARLASSGGICYHLPPFWLVTIRRPIRVDDYGGSIMRQFFTAMAMAVYSVTAVSADSESVPYGDLPLPPSQSQPAIAPLPDVILPSDLAPSSPATEGQPTPPSEPWCEPVELPGVWRYEAGVHATRSQNWGSTFGYWTNDPAYSVQTRFAFEKPGGTGLGLRHWAFNQNVRAPWGLIEMSVDTLFLDISRRFNAGRIEFVAGGGLAGAQMQVDYGDSWFNDLHLWGGGGDLFADMYYPMIGKGRTEFGFLGRGRVSLLATNREVLRHYVASIEELEWGLELRHRFKNPSHYWYIQLLREYQHWGSPPELFASVAAFEGTALNAGLAW